MNNQGFFRFSTSTLGLCAMVLICEPVLADDWTDKVTIRGFASAVFQQTDEAVFFNGDCDRALNIPTNMLPLECEGGTLGGEPGTVNGVTPEQGGINRNGSFRRSRIGLLVNAEVNDKTFIRSQFLSLEEEEEYSLHLDWGFIQMALNDNNSIRVGKIKMPVGLYNEYQSLGHAFNWIELPQLFYTTQFNGPNITRESYRGISHLWEGYSGDWSLSSDLYWGNVALEGMGLNRMAGYTFKASRGEMLTIQASTYSGSMTFEPKMPLMLNKHHRVKTIGANGSLNGFLYSVEAAKVTMGMDMMASDTWYASLGYKLDELTTLLFTHQDMAIGKNVPAIMKNAQTMDTITLRYDFADNVALKLEYSNINTDLGTGLFAAGIGETQPDNSVNMFGLSIDTVF